MSSALRGRGLARAPAAPPAARSCAGRATTTVPTGAPGSRPSRTGRVVRFEGDPAHPFTRGRLCARMSGYPDDVVFSPDRILHPLRRTGRKGEGRFERVSWDEALGEVADRLQKIVAEHGPTAVLPYSYAGTEGKIQGESLAGRFFVRMGASRLQRDVCGSAAHSGPDDDDRHQHRHPARGRSPTAASSWSGARTPRSATSTAGTSCSRRRRRAPGSWSSTRCARAPPSRPTLHLRPLPGTDAALALGMMHVIVREGLHDADYVSRHTRGLRPARARGSREYPPERVAAITGLAAARDRRPGPRVRDDEAGGHPAHDRHGAPRQRGQHLPDAGLPARPRRRLARARRRPRGVHARTSSTAC